MKAQEVIERRDEYYAHGSVLEAVSQGLYPDRKHIIREFVQNSYDALSELRSHDPRAELAPVEITASPPSLIIADKGIGMSAETMRRYRYLRFSEKLIGSHAGFRGIGKFSAISVCDRLIVRSSKLGDSKSYQVEIDAAAMFKRLREEKNPPLESVLKEHSQISETKEDSDQHYTVVELHGIHRDASELLNATVVNPYLVQIAPLPFDPAFSYAKEISQRLRQVEPRLLEIAVSVNGKPIYRPYLANASRPDFKEVFTKQGSHELIAFAWFCQHQGKGQFREAGDAGEKGRRHPYSGLHYRVSNFAIGDSMLVRKTLWHTTPERAFYFFGEIHVLDSGIIPTSDRDDLEDNTARGRLYEQCREVSTTLSFRAGLESQQRRFSEVVTGGQTLVSETEAALNSGKLETEFKDDKEYQMQKLLEDLSKRLKDSSGSDHKEEKVIKRAKKVLRQAERLQRTLKSSAGQHDLFVDISKDLRMDSKTKVLYDTIIAVLREEFRSDPQRFVRVVRRIHEALRKGT
jgi:hypothetical protein